MAQKLFEDKIGTLSHSGGTISLTSSRLTIGGQQYSISSLSRSIASDVTMAANTRYQIYAVLVAGVPVMRISANENSVGPSGFSSWKLVGSFYANGMSPVAFGSFVNIAGSPSSEWISFIPSIVGLTVGNGTLVGKWMRDGTNIKKQIHFNGGATSTYTSNYVFYPPSNIALDPSEVAGSSQSSNGAFTQIASATNYSGTVINNGSNSVVVISSNGGTAVWGNSYPATYTNGLSHVITLNAEYSATGFSTTSIKDL